MDLNGFPGQKNYAPDGFNICLIWTTTEKVRILNNLLADSLSQSAYLLVSPHKQQEKIILDGYLLIFVKHSSQISSTESICDLILLWESGSGGCCGNL